MKPEAARFYFVVADRQSDAPQRECAVCGASLEGYRAGVGLYVLVELPNGGGLVCDSCADRHAPKKYILADGFAMLPGVAQHLWLLLKASYPDAPYFVAYTLDEELILRRAADCIMELYQAHYSDRRIREMIAAVSTARRDHAEDN